MPLSIATFFFASTIIVQAQEKQATYLQQLKQDANTVSAAFGEDAEPGNRYSRLALSFLSAAQSLQPVSSRTVFWRKSPRTYLTPAEYEVLSTDEKKDFTKLETGEQNYYGHYSTPLAWARPFDRLSQHGFDSFDGKRILDFGFGNVGQLRMMASLGGEVTGIEIADGLQKPMYRLAADQDAVKKHSDAVSNSGSLKLVFGRWPVEKETADAVGAKFDLFISKNVLKFGYIHPEREAPASQLIDLGVDDETFLRSLHAALNPGGLALIYNIHPPKSGPDERYKPWAYGETPWQRELVEKVGFEVLEWHADDSAAIHSFGKQIGWDASFASDEDFKANFRAMATILKKPN